MRAKNLLHFALLSLVFGMVATHAGGCGGGDLAGLGPDQDGSTDGDAETGGTCAYAASFVTPAADAKLGVADDTTGNKCAAGLVTNVRVATSAPDGTAGKLLADGKQVGTATATSAQFVFAGISLPSKGAVQLRVQIGDDATCGATESITIDCNVPACSITTPKGPYLNGRAVADGGDRTSGPTDPFATKVVVATDIEDGQPVTLSVDGKPGTTVVASGGSAAFDSTVMSPDGQHTLSATCKNVTGNVGGSGVAEYTVITAPVDLTVTKPVAGTGFGLADDIDPATAGIQFKVCGTTTDPAAMNVPADARLGQKNLCTTLSGGSASCVSMGSAETCITVTCPDGSAPFDVAAVLSDKAGNQATTSVKGLHCASKLPSVQIVAPKAYASADPSTILNLAAGDAGSAAGALKKTVIACTDSATAKLTLNLGLAGSALSPSGAGVSPVVATAADGCPTGFGFVARFSGVVLPESVEARDGTGSLKTSSEIRVDAVDDTGNLGKSPAVDLWIDSVPPTLLYATPGCGKTYPGTTNVTDSVTISTDTLPVTLKVTGASSSANYPFTKFDIAGISAPANATLAGVTFYAGANDVIFAATDAAGNPSKFAAGCKAYVGNPPVIAITSPVDGAKLGADANVDAATHSYKASVTGTVTGTTTATTVTLRAGAAVLGTAPISGGTYTFASVLLAESDALLLTVELTDANYGTIGKSETLIVDTHAPSLTGSVAAVPDPAKRRGGFFDVSWPAGADYDPATGGTRACASYELRVSTTPITNDATYAGAKLVGSEGGGATSAVSDFGSLPVTAYAAMRCFDRVGNASGMITTGSTAVTSDFIVNALAGPVGTTDFGATTSAGRDFNGDGVPDLVVGSFDSAGAAFVYFGHRITSGSVTDIGFPAVPSLTITGTGRFGSSVDELQDFDGDGTPDLAIGAPLDGAGKVWIVSGRALRSASASPVASSSLGTNALVLAGDSTGASATGLVVASAGAFDKTVGTSVAVRGIFGGKLAVGVIRGRAIDGSTQTVPGQFDLLLQDTSTTANFGSSFAAQDVNGDGATDLFVGAPGVSNVYVFYGRSLAAPLSILSTSANTTYSGVPGEFFGGSIAISNLPGPVSATPDLMVGAQLANAGGGRASFPTSAGTTPIDDLTASDNLGARAVRTQPGSAFDVDGDGVTDILVCAAPNKAVRTGACYLWYGATAATFTLANASKTFSLQANTTDFISGSATLLGDVDGDGYLDFAVCSAGTNSCAIVR
jgi:hypothetical protein